MAEEESNISSTEEEDVEAHGLRLAASEPRDDAEAEKDDDVELHGRRKVK